MKIIFTMTLMVFGYDFAKADIAPTSYKGEEVNCDINMSFVKDPDVKDKSKLSVDMRIVSLPALKLSGKKIILDYGGGTLHCRNEYYTEVDGKLLVTACSDHQPGEPLDIKVIKFQDIKEPEKTEEKGSISEGSSKRKYFCAPNKSGTTNSKPNDTKNINGTR